jgi:hypothetical protein
METTASGVLVLLAAVLLVAVTAGVAYITTSEWRDRRRRESDGKR